MKTQEQPPMMPERSRELTPETLAAAESELSRDYGDYAGFVTRAAAFLIDALIIVTAVGAVTFISSFTGDFLRVDGFTLRLLQVATVSIAIGINVGYYVLLWSLAGFTVGKRLMGLIVVSKDGGRVTLSKAIRRYIGYYISAIFMLGYLWVILDPRRQGWHDKLAGTLVLYDWPDKVLLAEKSTSEKLVAGKTVNAPLSRSRRARLSTYESVPDSVTNSGADSAADATQTGSSALPTRIP